MTPVEVRAHVAVVRQRPRSYGDSPSDLESYLCGVVTGAAPGGVDMRDLWSKHTDPPLQPGGYVYADSTHDSVCDHALRVVDALWPTIAEVGASRGCRERGCTALPEWRHEITGAIACEEHAPGVAVWVRLRGAP